MTGVSEDDTLASGLAETEVTRRSNVEADEPERPRDACPRVSILQPDDRV